MRRRERGAGGTGRASRGRAASAAAAAPEPRAASGRAGPAGRTGTGAAGAMGGESCRHCPARGWAVLCGPRVARPGRCPPRSGPVSPLGAGRDRPSAAGWAEGRSGDRSRCSGGTAGQPEGKGTAGAVLPVRQRPGPRAAQASNLGNDQRQAAPGSARSEPQRPGRSPGGRRDSACPVTRRGRAGGAARDHRSLLRPWPHRVAGGAGPALPCAASRGPAPRPLPTIVVLLVAPIGLGSSRCAGGMREPLFFADCPTDS